MRVLKRNYFEQQLSQLTPMIGEITQKELDIFIQRQSAKGALNDGGTILGYATVGMTALLNGTKDILRKIETLKPSVEEWINIQTIIENLPNRQGEYLISKGKQRWRDAPENVWETFEEEVNKHKRIYSRDINIFIEGKKREIEIENTNKTKNITFDLMKILIGALLGYIIAILTKS